MNKGDQVIDSAANALQQKAQEWSGDGGLKAKLAEQLPEEAEFLRKLKPSLIKARARGEAPTDQIPGVPVAAPSGPQLGRRPDPKKRTRGGGPNPWLVVGISLAAGIALAKFLDWRGHAHPRG